MTHLGPTTRCGICGHDFGPWRDHCPACGATFVEDGDSGHYINVVSHTRMSRAAWSASIHRPTTLTFDDAVALCRLAFADARRAQARPRLVARPHPARCA